MSSYIKFSKTLSLYTILFLFISSAHASGWVSIAEEIAVVINETTNLYRTGETKQAKRKIIEAYFGIFESKKFEAAMRQEMGASYTYEVEQKFARMRKLIKKQRPITEIEQIAQDITSTIRKNAIILDKKEIPLNVFNPNK